jgi:hypothetical protein
VKNLVFGVIMGIVAVAAAANTDSPYVGQETRDIKALSPQDIDDYLNGSWKRHQRSNHAQGRT